MGRPGDGRQLTGAASSAAFLFGSLGCFSGKHCFLVCLAACLAFALLIAWLPCLASWSSVNWPGIGIWAPGANFVGDCREGSVFGNTAGRLRWGQHVQIDRRCFVALRLLLRHSLFAAMELRVMPRA